MPYTIHHLATTGKNPVFILGGDPLDSESLRDLAT